MPEPTPRLSGRRTLPCRRYGCSLAVDCRAAPSGIGRDPDVERVPRAGEGRLPPWRSHVGAPAERRVPRETSDRERMVASSVSGMFHVKRRRTSARVAGVSSARPGRHTCLGWSGRRLEGVSRRGRTASCPSTSRGSNADGSAGRRASPPAIPAPSSSPRPVPCPACLRCPAGAASAAAFACAATSVPRETSPRRRPRRAARRPPPHIALVCERTGASSSTTSTRPCGRTSQPLRPPRLRGLAPHTPWTRWTTTPPP